MPRDELPFAFSHGSVALVLPVPGIVIVEAGRLALERGHKTAAFRRQDLPSLIRLRIGDGRDLKTRRHHIGDVSGLMAKAAAILDAGGPARDKWRGDTSL